MGFDDGPALAAIAQRAAVEGFAPPADWYAAALAFEEDLAVLDGAEGRLACTCICAPSHWAPEHKLGLERKRASEVSPPQ